MRERGLDFASLEHLDRARAFGAPQTRERLAARRDEFAGRAMAAPVRTERFNGLDAPASRGYDVADAMMRARGA